MVTYIEPIIKTASTPHFFLAFILRPITDLIGTTRMSTSLMQLKRPLVFRRLGMSIHLPASDLSQIFARGLHSQILAIVSAK